MTQLLRQLHIFAYYITYTYICIHICLPPSMFSLLIILLKFLWFFTCVSWDILPSTNLVDCADYSFTSLRFFFLLFFYISLSWNLEICSYLFLQFFPVFFSALYLLHHSILFYSSFCFLFCLLPLYLFTLFSDFPYCLLFKSAILSFLSSFLITLFCLLLPYVLLLFILFSFC